MFKQISAHRLVQKIEAAIEREKQYFYINCNLAGFKEKIPEKVQQLQVLREAEVMLKQAISDIEKEDSNNDNRQQ